MLPQAFLERMQRLLGEEYGDFLEAFEKERSQGLCLNPRKISAEGERAVSQFGIKGPCAHTEQSEAAFASLSPVPWAEHGYYYEPGNQPGKHPFHEAGLYYIQEPSAMMPVGLLQVQPGERILDLCGAPGGKSAQIGARLRGKGILICNEIHPARAKILSENIERMGLGNVCVLNETPEHLAEVFSGYFDRILVDAPCSGEGMFRRNEAASEEWSPENVQMCANRQDGILDCAAKMLGSGGRLVYSTCTFAPEENEGSVSRFLRRHGDFRILSADKEPLGLTGCDGMPAYVEEPVSGLEDTVRLWPHRIRGEGHFAAVLQKDGHRLKEAGDFERKDRTKALETDKRPPVEFLQFCAENMKLCDGEIESILPEVFDKLCRAAGLEGGFKFTKFGDNLYLTPSDIGSLKGLKVLRPGLHLGEVKKNRFEPSHALALALDPRAAAHVWNLRAEDPKVAAYLGGQTFPAEGEKGWYLICVEGFGLGWGKLAGGTMKNHYPRGLRR